MYGTHSVPFQWVRTLRSGEPELHIPEERLLTALGVVVSALVTAGPMGTLGCDGGAGASLLGGLPCLSKNAGCAARSFLDSVEDPILRVEFVSVLPSLFLSMLAALRTSRINR